MSRIAGGGNCRSRACLYCQSRSVLDDIRSILEVDTITDRHLSNLFSHWARLLDRPVILPFCFQLTGTGGFLHLLGKSYVTFHQYDFLRMQPHSEETSRLFYYDQLLNTVLGEF